MQQGLTSPALPAATSSVMFRTFEAGDFGVLADIRRDAKMQALLLTVPDATGDAAVYDWIERRAGDKDGLFRIVADGASGAALGYAQITQIHRRNRLGYGGIALSGKARLPGLGQATLRYLLKTAAHDLALRKLMSEVRIDNFPAIQLNLQAGYRIVGTLERHFQSTDRLYDVLQMERWLEDIRL